MLLAALKQKALHEKELSNGIVFVTLCGIWENIGVLALAPLHRKKWFLVLLLPGL